MNINQNNLVEILMATYNGELYIREQIESIINQSYSNWVLRIKDDCSTDRTYEILKEYQGRFPEKIIISQSTSPTGEAKRNFFELLKLAEAEYIMCCDQDDVWLEHKVEVSLGKLLSIEKCKSGPVLVHTDLSVVNQEKEVISQSYEKVSKINCKRKQLQQILIENVVTGCTMIFNRKLLNIALIGTCDIENIKMHDHWLAIVASIYGETGYINEQLILYRQHEYNSVGAKKANSLSKILKSIFNKENELMKIRESCNQAKVIYKYYGENLNDQDRISIKEFMNLLDYTNKFRRVWIVLKNKFYKNYFVKNIALLLWL